MDEKPPIPTALKVIAILFILGGIYSVLEILVGLTHHRISFNFGVLGLFIGSGLLNLRPGWRTCALVFTWFSFIVLPIFTLLLLAHPGPINVDVFGQKVGNAPTALGLTIAAGLFLFTIWQYRVLTRPDIRKLFGLQNG